MSGAWADSRNDGIQLQRQQALPGDFIACAGGNRSYLTVKNFRNRSPIYV
jgi:hypothetical protein